MPATPSSTEVPVARPSSTVVVVRDAGTPEVLMVRRQTGLSFGGAFVFPGGVLDEGDRRVAAHCDGIDADQADAMFNTGNALDYFSAAVRELFEETGILLADRGNEDIETVRNGLNNGEIEWADFVTDNDMRLHCDALHYFSFWITPEALPKRYSTRFFLAALPGGQEAAHCGGELTESCWVSPAEALQARRRGRMSMHYPTIRTLESLAGFDSADAMLDWAKDRAEEGVPCIFPEIGGSDGEPRVIIGGDDAGALE